MHLPLPEVDIVWYGRMQEEMQKKVAKWQEPPPGKQTRVLPVPDMEPKKRRGGRRARKYKERYGLTDVRKVPHPYLALLLCSPRAFC